VPEGLYSIVPLADGDDDVYVIYFYPEKKSVGDILVDETWRSVAAALG
jgi:hypothetical protein